MILIRSDHLDLVVSLIYGYGYTVKLLYTAFLLSERERDQSYSCEDQQKNQMLGTHIGAEINTLNNTFFIDTR